MVTRICVMRAKEKRRRMARCGSQAQWLAFEADLCGVRRAGMNPLAPDDQKEAQ